MCLRVRLSLCIFDIHVCDCVYVYVFIIMFLIMWMCPYIVWRFCGMFIIPFSRFILSFVYVDVHVSVYAHAFSVCVYVDYHYVDVYV